MFQIRWLRRWIRRSTKPISHEVAHNTTRKLSLAYGFLAWNALAVVAYAMYTGKRDWASFHGLEKEPGTPSQQFARMMDIPKAKVVRISGFSTTEEYDIDNTVLFDNKQDETINNE